MAKNLYIISGCNGAGKTTASYTVLPEILDCREFVNADEIARGLFLPLTIGESSTTVSHPERRWSWAAEMPIQKFSKTTCMKKSEAMSNKEVQDFTRKLEAGLQLAEKRMLEEKALHDETIVVSNEAGKIEYLSAREVLATY